MMSRRPPDRLEPGGDVLERARKVVGGGEGAAAEAGPLDVLALQVNRQRVDVGRIGEHQHRQVLVEDGGDLGRAHAGSLLGERLARIGAQAQRRHTDQRQHAHAVTEHGGRQAGDLAAEREASHAQLRVLGEQLVYAGDHHLGDALRHPRLGRHGRIAEPGNVDDPQLVVLGQLRDVADPVRPGARPAVEQQHRLSGAPHTPDHGAVAARRPHLACGARQGVYDGGRIGVRCLARALRWHARLLHSGRTTWKGTGNH